MYVRIHLTCVHSPLLFGKTIRIERIPVRAAILGCLGFICNEGVGIGVFLHSSKTYFFWVACKLRCFSANYDNTFCLESLYLKKDLLAVLPTGYGYNLSRFERANSAFQKFAYSWQNSGLHEAPAYPRTRFCSGGKRQKTGSNKKNIGERSDLSCCLPRVPIGLLRSPMLFFHPRHFQIPAQSANWVLKIEVWSFYCKRQTAVCG